MKTKSTHRIVMMLGAAVLMAGCSALPKVVADVTETLPARSADSVLVYEAGDEFPPEAREIGKVKVTDGGMTPTYNCLYGNMLALAVRKTAACGGNALYVDEHKFPSAASTCHRIWGTMYVVPDSLMDGTSPQATLADLEASRDQELASMARQQISRREKTLANPANILKVSIGPAWITSEIETYQRTYKSKSGLGVTAEYQHLWGSGLGVGVNYLYFGTSFDEGYDVSMHYFGPALVASLMLGSKWRMDASLGLGYSKYTESLSGYHGFGASGSESGLGVVAQLGIEYMLTKQMGIGFQTNSFTMSMDKPDGYDIGRNDFYGIKRFQLQLGLRVYL